jgi:hypothetical protein
MGAAIFLFVFAVNCEAFAKVYVEFLTIEPLLFFGR